MPAAFLVQNYSTTRLKIAQLVDKMNSQQTCEQVVIIQAAVIPDQAATSLFSSTW